MPEAKMSFDSETGEVCFDYRFNEDTEITGYMSLHAWVSVDGYDDGDLFFTVKKIGQDGKTEIPVLILGEAHPGAWSKLRLSWRGLSNELSTVFRPELAFEKQEKLEPGEVVPIDIAFVPYSRIWHKGETLRLHIAGRYIRDESGSSVSSGRQTIRASSISTAAAPMTAICAYRSFRRVGRAETIFTDKSVYTHG